MTEPTTPPEQTTAAETATEQTQAPQGNATPPQERASRQDKPSVKKSATVGPALGAIAIVLVIALGAGLYYHGHQQSQQQQANAQRLLEQLNALHTAQAQEQLRITALLNQQAKALDVATQLQANQSQQLKALEQKVAAIAGNDANTWKLAQADFMVKLAERKLWSDQDVTTAAALLKSADSTLAGLDDPSLLGVRRALTEDIATLATLNQIDFDGIILQLNQLANQVDDLRLADNDSDEAPLDQDDGELSASLSQWRQNLAKSWRSFIAEFITIRRRDSSAEPLLAPNQDVYLRENIRSRLLIAAQAVPRHQLQIYHQSLESVSAWVRAYFDVNDPSTKAFLNQIDDLSQQSISMVLPDTLKSQPLLDTLLHTRSSALMSAPVTSAAQGE